MNGHIDAFLRHHNYEYDDPYYDIEALAAYLIHPDNDAPDYTKIRKTILGTYGRAEFPFWPVQIVEMVTNFPEARMLMADCESKAERFKLAVNILNTAMWLMLSRNKSDEDDEEECGR